MPRRKQRTLEELERMRQKAVQFVRDVAGDEERAQEFESMSPQDDAEHKCIEIVANPRRRRHMPKSRPTRDELLGRVEQLESENAELNDKLNSIADLAAADEDDEFEDSEDEDEP